VEPGDDSAEHCTAVLIGPGLGILICLICEEFRRADVAGIAFDGGCGRQRSELAKPGSCPLMPAAGHATPREPADVEQHHTAGPS